MIKLDVYLNMLEEETPRIVEFVRKLVTTTSLSGEEKRVSELVVGEMEDLGYLVVVDEMGNVVGSLGEGEPMVLFDGHMDHIGEGSRDSWSHGPYDADIIDGVMYGRGSVDMKGSLAAMIYGCAIRETKGRVVLSCVVHEETNEGVASSKIIKEHGLRPSVCVLGEPTDLHLSIGQRGRCVFRITTRGKTSHASMPDHGRNAIYEMTPIIGRINNAGKRLPRDPFLGAGSMAVTSISCSPGSGPIVPDRCEVIVDRRLVPQERLEDVTEEMRQLSKGGEVELVEDLLTCYTGFRAAVKQYFPGWVTPNDHWAVSEGLQCLEYAMNRRPQIIGWKFSTDGVATAGALGIPTIGFGPGDPVLAHQPNEHVSLKDVVLAARGFRALAYRFTNRSS